MPAGMTNGVALSRDELRPEVIERFWAKVDKQRRHWLWTGARSKSGQSTCYVGGELRPPLRTAPRVAWVLQHGSIGAGEVVRVACEEPLCVRHLATQDARSVMSEIRLKQAVPGRLVADEARRMWLAGALRSEIRESLGLSRHGLTAILGNRTYLDPGYVNPYQTSGPAKLHPKDVVAARQAHLEGKSVGEVARMFGVHRNTASEVLHGQSWSSLPFACTIKHGSGRPWRERPKKEDLRSS